jgi:hypothetical protein
MAAAALTSQAGLDKGISTRISAPCAVNDRLPLHNCLPDGPPELAHMHSHKTVLLHLPLPAGVRLSDGSLLSSQLVVDCSGRGSVLPSWLKAAGYKTPRTTRAGCDVGYAGW